MNTNELSIDELASAAGLTRRAIRFYVQQRLLPPPLSLGRKATYSNEHVEKIRKIIELQSAGHSLEEIRRIFAGVKVETPLAARRIKRPVFTARLVSKITLIDGIDLEVDTTRFQLRAEDIVALQKLVQTIFTPMEA